MKKLTKRKKLKYIYLIALLLASIFFYRFVFLFFSFLSSPSGFLRILPILLTYLIPSIYPIEIYLLLQVEEENNFRKILKVFSLIGIILPFISILLFVMGFIDKTYSMDTFFTFTSFFPIDVILINILVIASYVFSFFKYDKWNLEKLKYHYKERKTFKILNPILFVIYYIFSTYFFSSLLISIFSFMNYGGKYQGVVFIYYLAFIYEPVIFLTNLLMMKEKYRNTKKLFILTSISLILSGLILIFNGIFPQVIEEELAQYFIIDLLLCKNISPYLLVLTLILPNIYLLIKNHFKEEKKEQIKDEAVVNEKSENKEAVNQ